MKKLAALGLSLVMIFSMSMSVFANTQNDKSTEFKNLMIWAEEQGFQINGNIDEVDLEKVDLEEVKNELQALISIGKDIELNESVEVEPQTMMQSNIDVQPFELDYQEASKIVRKAYSNSQDINGKAYTYYLIVRADYDFYHDRNLNPYKIININNATAYKDHTFNGRDFTVDTATITTKISSNKTSCNVRGEGEYEFGLEQLNLSWRVGFRMTFKVGEGEWVY